MFYYNLIDLIVYLKYLLRSLALFSGLFYEMKIKREKEN